MESQHYILFLTCVLLILPQQTFAPGHGLRFDSNSIVCLEDVGACEVTVLRDGVVGSASFRCLATEGTAKEGQDFISPDNEVFELATEADETICTVTIVHDYEDEVTEEFTLKLAFESFSLLSSSDTTIYIENVQRPQKVISCNETTTISLSQFALSDFKLSDGDDVVISPVPLSSAEHLPPECVQPFNGGAIMFEINITTCSPIITEDDYVINVTYVVRNQPLKTSSSIQRFEDICLEFTCSFDKKENLTEGSILPSINKIQLDSVQSDAKFELDINFFNNASFDEELDDLNVIVPDNVYVGVDLSLARDEDFVVQLTTCFATSTPDRYDPPIYHLINDGCAAEDEVEILRNYEVGSAEFSFQSFVWTGIADDEQEIYVHCEVTVCFNSTDPECTMNNCPGRKRRALQVDGSRQFISSKAISILPQEIETCEKVLFQSSGGHKNNYVMDNGGCSDRCTMFRGDVVCTCFESRVLSADEKSCYTEQRDAGQFENPDRKTKTDSHLLLISAVCALCLAGFLLFISYKKNNKLEIYS